MAEFLALLHTEGDGSLPKAARETVAAAAGLARQAEGRLTVGIIGRGAAAAADSLAGCGAAAFLTVSGDDVAEPRYATDAAAAAALIEAAGAAFTLAPGTSRFARCLPGAAERAGAQTDTHIVSLRFENGTLHAQRWFYRQRILGSFTRDAPRRLLLIDGGVYAPYEGAPGAAAAREVPVAFAEEDRRTAVKGIESPAAGGQTVKPDAELLFVAGAGWTKKQKDGQTHLDEAGELIQTFLKGSKASLGSSKSVVDLQSEGQASLSFITHLNQVGQTGATPRHAKGLSTCCHGEEPHVVGWRFVNERRAVNLDPNCGWAQGKADVLYVADAFEVMAKVNALLNA